MISKCIAFLVAALVLAYCCVSGSGCGVSPGGPVAWDGLGSAPAEDSQPIELRSDKMRSKKEIIVGPLGAAERQQNGKFQPRDNWEKQQAADQDEEMRLKRKLVIIAPEPNRDDAAASAAH